MTEVTQAQFYAEVQKLRDHIDEKHKSLRESMENGFARLDVKLDAHVKDDNDVERRVVIIETQRTEEAKLQLRRGTWAGLLAGVAIQVAMKIADYVTGRN